MKEASTQSTESTIVFRWNKSMPVGNVPGQSAQTKWNKRINKDVIPFSITSSSYWYSHSDGNHGRHLLSSLQLCVGSTRRREEVGQTTTWLHDKPSWLNDQSFIDLFFSDNSDESGRKEGRKEAWREDASGENYSQKVGVCLGEEKRKNNQKITRRRDFPQFLSVDDDWWCLWVNRSSWTLSNTSTQALFHSLWPTAWLSKSDVWIFEWKTREN